MLSLVFDVFVVVAAVVIMKAYGDLCLVADLWFQGNQALVRVGNVCISQKVL